jgi:hypothetical protein
MQMLSLEYSNWESVWLRCSCLLACERPNCRAATAR